MTDSKLADRFATPNSSKLAQILLDLRGVDAQAGICNLQPTDVQLWPESFKTEHDEGSNADFNNQQDTCNCRKSKCLKLYCQCFAARATCSASCRCLSCENRPENGAVRDAAVNIILERNPNAFDSKYRPTGPAMVASTFTAISSIAHKNGCRCRKSLCLKKYCECFQGGVPCSAICTCLTCQNTGPGAHAMAAGIMGMGAEVAATDREPSELLLSDHIQLSNQSIFMDSSTMEVLEGATHKRKVSIEDTGDNRKRGSTENAVAPLAYTGSSGASSSGAGASSSGICKPPLVPSHKRKRDSRGSAGAVGGNSAGEEEAATAPAMAMTGAAAYSSGAGSSSNATGLIATPAWSREEQQQLLKQLLYQELESQGILSSPFASFINHNCPGLLLSQDTGLADISSMLGQQSQGPNQGQAQSATMFSSPAGVHPAPTTALGPAMTNAGPYAASPNSISIATAIALLAANHAARGTGPSTNQSPFHTLTPVTQTQAAATPAGNVNSAGHHFDRISRILNGSSTCTPQQLHANEQDLLSHSQQDCTDEETTGSVVSSTRSDCMMLSAGRSLDQTTLPSKVLFGREAEGAHTPDTDSELHLRGGKGLGLGDVATRIMQGAVRDKENAGPNASMAEGHRSAASSSHSSTSTMAALLR